MLNIAQQQKNFNILQSMGEVALASEFTMVLDDFPEISILLKEFPVPISAAKEAIAGTLVGGQSISIPALARTHFSGTISFIDTVHTPAMDFIRQAALERSITKRGKFNFTIYLGTVEDHTKKIYCQSAFLHSFEPLAADSENAAPLVWTGQIDYYCFEA